VNHSDHLMAFGYKSRNQAFSHRSAGAGQEDSHTTSYIS
jgi:hypothetical protein